MHKKPECLKLGKRRVGRRAVLQERKSSVTTPSHVFCEKKCLSVPNECELNTFYPYIARKDRIHQHRVTRLGVDA